MWFVKKKKKTQNKTSITIKDHLSATLRVQKFTQQLLRASVRLVLGFLRFAHRLETAERVSLESYLPKDAEETEELQKKTGEQKLAWMLLATHENLKPPHSF